MVIRKRGMLFFIIFLGGDEVMLKFVLGKKRREDDGCNFL